MLDRLAVSLGRPLEAFFDPALSEEGHTLELLRLWLTIEDRQDRAKVLALLQSMSGNVQGAGEPVYLAHAMQKPDKV